MSKGNFLKVFIKQPKVNASITPSSKRAARAMIKDIDLSKMKFVVELGPGTGVFTDILAKRLTQTVKFYL